MANIENKCVHVKRLFNIRANIDSWIKDISNKLTKDLNLKITKSDVVNFALFDFKEKSEKEIYRLIKRYLFSEKDR